MTPNRPYLIRALHEWILDNGMTPHLLVDATMEGVSVPEQYIDDGKIILNTSLSAIQDLEMANDWILFNARFSGALFNIQLPIRSVLAIYAKENGRGMVFPEELDDSESQSQEQGESQLSQPATEKENKGKPHLTVIK